MHEAEAISWYILAGMACVVVAIGAGMIAQAARQDPPPGEMPELHPDDDPTADWSETTVPAPPPSPSRYEPLEPMWRGTSGPRPPRAEHD